MKSKEEKLKENIADVIENGPRLSYSRNTWILAKSECGKYVFRGGLGGMGVGQMWCEAYGDDFTNPEYINAPVYRRPGPVPGYTTKHMFILGEKVE